MENTFEYKEPSKPSAPERVWERLSFLRNKYVITAVVFLTWMLFIDRNDVATQWKRIQELNTLQQNEKIMDVQISQTKQELDLLKTSPATLEKYARERYLMKKDNEDLFIIGNR